MLAFYTLQKFLVNSQDDSRLTISQKKFFQNLLDGQVDSNTGSVLWKSLRFPTATKGADLRTPTYNEIEQILSYLKAELNKTSYFAPSQFHYKNCIRKIYDNFTIISNHMLRFGLAGSKSPSTELEKLLTQAAKINEITRQCNGEMKLACNERLDPKLGNNELASFGYVIDFGGYFLRGERPWGIDWDQPTPLKPIPYSSTTIKQNPLLNHLVRVSGRIAEIQDNARNQKKYLKIMSNGLPRGKWVGFEILDPHYFNHSSDIAKDLVSLVDKNDKQYLGCRLRKTYWVHDTGFCKKDNKYHFFDASIGWVSFNNSKDFINWFPLFWDAMKYNNTFVGYHINSFTIGDKKPGHLFTTLQKILFAALTPLLIIPVSAYIGFHLVKSSAILASRRGRYKQQDDSIQSVTNDTIDIEKVRRDTNECIDDLQSYLQPKERVTPRNLHSSHRYLSSLLLASSSREDEHRLRSKLDTSEATTSSANALFTRKQPGMDCTEVSTEAPAAIAPSL